MIYEHLKTKNYLPKLKKLFWSNIKYFRFDHHFQSYQTPKKNRKHFSKNIYAEIDSTLFLFGNQHMHSHSFFFFFF